MMPGVEGMNQKELKEIFKEASKLMIKEEDWCRNLIYPKVGGKVKIREPEARYAITMILTDRGIRFGIETPTKGKYIISGSTPDRGNTDLVIFSDGKEYNIELKEGQAKIRGIAKDFKKMFGENADGYAFFNILESSNRRTLPELLKKYQRAYDAEKGASAPKSPKWFVLFILVRKKKQAYWKVFDNIVGISGNEFEGVVAHPFDLTQL